MNEIIIKFDSVSFSYDDVHVLENASFHVHHGEFVAMVGPNGSGKTTVLKLLFGLASPDSGKIELFGTSAKIKNDKKTAYVSQHMPSDNSFPITVRDVVRMGLLRPLKGYSSNRSSEGRDAVAEAMKKTGITELEGRQYGSLSGGQKRRVLVARALAAKPELLVLDEPTANMDIESEARLYETLGAYKGEMTILIVTHDTEFVSSLTDRVLCLGDGSRNIVQHRIEASPDHHGLKAQVLHGENISCC
ncbi:MAG: metal ABC transporter ATP-binding protein [Treponema sp.]|nr:metal ABC transporter ATP-binding protein [Treponema sp.]MCL2272532.1 metal ABC transporter ATP-binding protein [Treponema sp.]